MIAIGRYYSFYKRRAKALEYFDQSFQIKKRLKREGHITNADLVDNYYSYCATFRELNEPLLADNYLDSCFMYYEPAISVPNLSYLQFERANLLKVEGKFQQALEIFKKIEPWFQKNNPGYQVLLFTYMGDAFRGMGNFRESESYYLKALDASKTYNSHIDFTPLIHKRLSKIYTSVGDLKKNSRTTRNN